MIKSKKNLRLILFILLCYSIFRTYFLETDLNGFPNRFIAYLTYVIDSDHLEGFNLLPLFNDSYMFYNDDILTALYNTEKYFPNTLFLYVILYKFTLIDPVIIMKLPIGYITITPILFIILKKYNIYNKKIFILIILLMFNKRNIFSVNYIAPFSYLLFLIIIDLYKNMEYNFNSKYYIMYILLFFSLINYWHTLSIFTLFFIMSNIIIYSLSVFINYENKINNYIVLAIITIILFLLNTLLWKSSFIIYYLDNINILNLFYNILSRISGKNPFITTIYYNYFNGMYGKLYHYSLILIYLSLLFIILYDQFLIIGKKNIHNYNKKIRITLSLFLSELFQILFYLVTQSINLFYFFLYPLSFKQNNRKYVFYLLFLISIINIVACDLSYDLGRRPDTKRECVVKTYPYFEKNYSGKIISDYNIGHIFIKRDLEDKLLTNEYLIINEKTYVLYLNNRFDNNEFMYIFDINSINKGLPIDTRGSRGFLLDSTLLNSNILSNKIYENKYIGAYK